MAGEKIGVGLIGLGGISFAHEAGYSELGEECEIVAMCDINAEEAASRAALYEAKAYWRYQDLLDDPRVDMVDIIVPHHLHYEIAAIALAKGKHVLVEKPITATWREGLHLLEQARRAKGKLGVAENTRFVTAYQKAESILSEGLLGDIWSVRTLIAGSEIHRLKDPSQWHGKAPYGGVILDSAVHNFYLFKWLFGGVRDVLGFASKIIPESETEDNGLILGHLANGAEYQLNVSCTMEIPWTERLEVYGSRGGMIIDQLANPVLRYYQGTSDIDGTTPVDEAGAEVVPFDPFAWKYNSMIAEIKDFVSAILEDRPPLVDPADALYALRAAEAVYQSIESQQPVSL